MTSPRILVVDDAADYLAFMQTLLSSEGYDVALASTLEDAERHLCCTSRLPDLVISDVLLPGHAPFAVIHLLDRLPHTRALPVLLCTGAVREVEEWQGKHRREKLVIIYKPFDIDLLLSAINDMLARPY